MVIKRLDLKQFRNYSDQKFEFNRKFNFIYGENGQGKTNILEGISYSSFTKSFLGASEIDCVMFGKDGFRINADYENDLGNFDHLSVNYDTSSKTKTILLNREKVSSYSSAVFGKFPVVYLTPRSLNITYGNPSERRKFFDILISQTSRLYLDYLKDLARVLKQKNSLLRDYSMLNKYSRKEVEDISSAYNEKLVDISSHIIFKRLSFLAEYYPVLVKNFSSLSGSGNESKIVYYSDAFGEIPFENITGLDFESIYNVNKDFFNSKLDEEIKRGISAAGPQRDDYIFRINKNSGNTDFFDLKNYASQGEHKTFLTSLKLSEFDYLKEKRSASPVLLLDDVLSELDENRVSKIISHLNEFGQIFLTTTGKDYLKNLSGFYSPEEINVYRIENGKAYAA